METTKRKAAGRKRRISLGRQRKSMAYISLILVILTGAMGISSYSLQQKMDAYQAQEKELSEQIAEEESRQAEIDDLENYVGTDEYVEDVAREKLGLVYSDEIVFKAE